MSVTQRKQKEIKMITDLSITFAKAVDQADLKTQNFFTARIPNLISSQSKSDIFLLSGLARLANGGSISLDKPTFEETKHQAIRAIASLSPKDLTLFYKEVKDNLTNL